jgi:hypothetical protein
MPEKNCVWPSCLTEAEQDELADEVVRQMRGEAPAPPKPDRRTVCGCTEN